MRPAPISAGLPEEGVSGAMHATHREMEILDALRRSGSCRIHELARRLDVSEETIRQCAQARE